MKKDNLPIREVTDIKKAKELGFLIAQAARFKKWRELSFEQLNSLPWENKADSSVSQEKSQKKENLSDVASS